MHFDIISSEILIQFNTVARPGDVTIRRWVNGKDGAIDVTVTGSLCPSNVAGAAANAGASLSKAYERKIKETAEACRLQGLVFLPFAMETLGGLHSGAVTQVKQLAAVLARSKGLEEGEMTAQLFAKLSLTLMRGNALISVQDVKMMISLQLKLTVSSNCLIPFISVS